MSVSGQSETSTYPSARSALPLSTDIISVTRHVRKVPTADNGTVSERFGAAHVCANRAGASTLLIAGSCQAILARSPRKTEAFS
jgi:hypothetical protein